MGHSASARNLPTPPEDAVIVSANREILRWHFDQGRRTHGELSLDFDLFAQRCIANVSARGRAAGRDCHLAEISEALKRLVGQDIYLALACDVGIEAAWRTLSERYRAGLTAHALRRGLPRAEAEDHVAAVLAELALPPPAGGARTRMGTYLGRGSLASWLAVIVLRRFVDRVRAPLAPLREETPGTEDDRDLRVPPRPPARDPARLALDAEAARLLQNALDDAWPRLTAREREAVLLRYREGHCQRDIARRLGVGEARVSRILQAAVEKFRRATERHMRRESGKEDLGEAWTALRVTVAESLARFPLSSDSMSDV
ncbi:MAG: sigma-70 family RNA polymerase sigma factor [Planctomycetota bacterium]